MYILRTMNAKQP